MQLSSVIKSLLIGGLIVSGLGEAQGQRLSGDTKLQATIEEAEQKSAAFEEMVEAFVEEGLADSEGEAVQLLRASSDVTRCSCWCSNDGDNSGGQNRTGDLAVPEGGCDKLNGQACALTTDVIGRSGTYSNCRPYVRQKTLFERLYESMFGSRDQ